METRTDRLNKALQALTSMAEMGPGWDCGRGSVISQVSLTNAKLLVVYAAHRKVWRFKVFPTPMGAVMVSFTNIRLSLNLEIRCEPCGIITYETDDGTTETKDEASTITAFIPAFERMLAYYVEAT